MELAVEICPSYNGDQQVNDAAKLTVIRQSTFMVMHTVYAVIKSC